jgi:3-hydroxyisobutyrate dehydrogenase
MAEETLGFIGLGNMGGAMHGHVARAHDTVVFDIAGTQERAVPEARIAGGIEQIAQTAGVIALSLPTVAANQEVIAQIAALGKPGLVVIDSCTIGPPAAKANAEKLAAAGMLYLDSPVSGLKFKAADGTLTTMCSGSDEAFERGKPIFESYSANVYRVGTEPGQGQAMKLLNNALVISSYVTTTEVMIYGEANGLDKQTMLDVINVSSGMNFTTKHIYPKHIVTEEYDSGAAAEVVRKDISLFLKAAQETGTEHPVIAAAHEIIDTFATANPDADQMWLYPFLRDGKTDQS